MTVDHTPASLGAVFPAHAQPEMLPAFASRIETLGYDELWVIEDCFLSGGLALASAALAATSHLRVGVGLLPAAVRNAAICAMEIATIARIYPGRLSVAFGHGVESWMRQIDARPPRRLAALGEVVSAVKALLAGDRLEVDGSFVKLSGVELEHPPSEPPDILIGTTGPAGLRLAARRADGLLLAEGCGPRFIAEAAQTMVEAAAPSAAPEIVTYAWMRIGDDAPSQALLAAAISSWADSGLFPGPVAASGAAEPGFSASALVDELAVTGGPRACAAAVGRLVDAGAGRVILAAVGADAEDQYARFAEDVLSSVGSRGSE